MQRLILVGVVALSLVARWVVAQPPVPAEPPLTPAERSAVRAAEEARIRAIDSVYGSVVAIYGNDRGGGGSGVLYDSAGLALTNHHVVAGAGVEGWAGLADGKLYRWKLIGTDPGGDVAIIQLLGKDSFPIAPLGDSNTVRVGDFAMAMGNPFILAEDQRPTVTLGLVSGIERYQPGAGENTLVYGNCIQVDSSINPGNSGGPLFNLRGEVIGINGRGSFKERGRVNVGLGYAISSNQVKNFIPDLLATKLAQHGTLDAVFGNRAGDVVCHTLNLDAEIAKAGMKLGDKLISFEGQPITSANQFTNLITTLPANWPCEVTFEHEGKQSTVFVRLTPLPYGGQQPPPPMPKPMEPKKEEPKKEEPKPSDKPKEEKPAEEKKPADGEKKPEEPKPTDKPADGEKKPEGEKKTEPPKPMEIRPTPPKPPNFGTAGLIRDKDLNAQNARRLMTRVQQVHGFGPSQQGQSFAGWKVTDQITRGEENVGEQTIIVARDGRFQVTVKLDGKTSRFGHDGKEYWAQIGSDDTVVYDAERLARNPFAAQGYLLATLQTKEPLASIGKIELDAGDKASKQLAYRIKAVDEATDEFFVWLSVLDTAGQPQVRVLKTAETFDDERTQAVVYDQWKNIGGGQIPHQRRVVSGMAEKLLLTITTQQAETVASFEDALFQKPQNVAPSK